MATANDVISHANSHIGCDGTVFNEWYWGYDSGYAWCATFQSYVAMQECGCDISRSASAAGFCLQFPQVADPKPGDYVFFGWDGIEQTYFREQSHVALVTDVRGDGSFDVVEGNNSQGLVGTNTYTVNDYYYVAFYRPDYDENDDSEEEPDMCLLWVPTGAYLLNYSAGYMRPIDNENDLAIIRALYHDTHGTNIYERQGVDDNWIANLPKYFKMLD